MNVTVSLSATFTALDDGSCWTSSNVGYTFWTRYLSVFDQVTVLARVKRRSRVTDDMLRVDGPGVSVTPLIAYRGPGQFLRHGYAARRQIIDLHNVDGAIIMRVPSTTANIAYKHLQRKGAPYGVEVVGDPEDVFAPGASDHLLSPFFRMWFSRHQRVMVRGASAVSYVTSGRLQQRYPAGDAAFATHYSSIDLRDDAFVSESPVMHVERPVRCVFVGSLEKPYKGLDVLIEAISLCRDRGLEIDLTILGDGQERKKLEMLAVEKDISSAVRFEGRVQGGDSVRGFLDASDIFVLPSRTEGLPRAMIEAMARGLPCIGTFVGGIPELLPEEDLVPPGDPESLSRKILEVVVDPVRMRSMGSRNLEMAKTFHARTLETRRNDFYVHVKLETQQWVNRT
jgi:glycosyltransferase involved in cell wall biosynthesis